MSDLAAKVIEAVREVYLAYSPTADTKRVITADTVLEELGFDSLDFLELSIELEDELERSVDDLDECATVSDVIAKVTSDAET